MGDRSREGAPSADRPCRCLTLSVFSVTNRVTKTWMIGGDGSLMMNHDPRMVLITGRRRTHLTAAIPQCVWFAMRGAGSPPDQVQQHPQPRIHGSSADQNRVSTPTHSGSHDRADNHAEQRPPNEAADDESQRRQHVQQHARPEERGGTAGAGGRRGAQGPPRSSR